jgi:hypothetical protein
MDGSIDRSATGEGDDDFVELSYIYIDRGSSGCSVAARRGRKEGINKA